MRQCCQKGQPHFPPTLTLLISQCVGLSISAPLHFSQISSLVWLKTVNNWPDFRQIKELIHHTSENKLGVLRCPPTLECKGLADYIQCLPNFSASPKCKLKRPKAPEYEQMDLQSLNNGAEHGSNNCSQQISAQILCLV